MNMEMYSFYLSNKNYIPPPEKAYFQVNFTFYATPVM